MSITATGKVIVPVDFSEQSMVAVGEALKMVGSAANIEVVHVLPELSPVEPGVVWQVVDDANRASHAREAIEERLSDDKYAGIHISVLFGDPGDEITKQAETSHADMIIMPSHGRTGLKRLLIGSVAERVVRLAHCPVLVLRHTSTS